MKNDGASIAKSTRAERAAWNAEDFTRATEYPQLGRDVPWKNGPNGYPIPEWEVRVQAYGPEGLFRETKCVHCHKWLSYEMCSGCQSLLRLTGKNDQGCRCFTDSLWIYGHCEDHKRFEKL